MLKRPQEQSPPSPGPMPSQARKNGNSEFATSPSSKSSTSLTPATSVKSQQPRSFSQVRISPNTYTHNNRLRTSRQSAANLSPKIHICESSTMGDANVTTSEWRTVQVGRVVLFARGPYAGKLATIVEIIDHKRVRHCSDRLQEVVI